jgi:hypothetical protein
VRVTPINRDDDRIAIGPTTASLGDAPDLPFDARICAPERAISVREAAAHTLIVLARCPSCFTGVMRRQIEWYSRVVALLLFGGVIGYGIGAGSLAFVIVPVAVFLLLLLTGQFRLPRPPRSD